MMRKMFNVGENAFTIENLRHLTMINEASCERTVYNWHNKFQTVKVSLSDDLRERVQLLKET
jgi:hypothetical protein